MSELLDTMEFRANPFSSFVAEKEPEIEKYFIRPPYFTQVETRGMNCESMILFGARGAGKSASRVKFYKECWRKVEKGEKAPLAIVLDDYARVIPKSINDVHLGNFISEVGYLTIEAVLAWLSALDEEKRELHLNTLIGSEESTAIALVKRFYLSRPELVRSTTARETLELLNQSWKKRTKLWVEGRWDKISDLISNIAQSFARKEFDDETNIANGLKGLLSEPESSWRDATYAKALLGRFSEFAQMFGFSGIIVLIDKVDETPQTSNSAASTATLLYPLISTTQLLEINDFGWLFFLWDKVTSGYNEKDQSIRLDKIANATIKWQDEFLKNLVNRRLEHFSSGKVTSFNQLCEPDMLAEEALSAIIQLCMRSPRDLIRILDTVIREHDEQLTQYGSKSLLIGENSINIALDKYSTESLPRIYKKHHLQQIIRMPNTTFINKDVQSIFKMNDQTARIRIKAWEDSGMVVRSGSRQAEGGQAGKPAHEYTIADARLTRLIQRNLSLGPEFDSLEDGA